MKNEDILKQAIKKAVKNGWKRLEGFDITIKTPTDTHNLHIDDLIVNCTKWQNKHHLSFDQFGESIIFNHDFAKAFFGGSDDIYTIPYKDKAGRLRTDKVEMPMWQWRLQEMVLEKDPLKYLAKVL